MTPFISEFVGTALLLLLGNGVVANVVLQDSKGRQSGWIVITFGWAIAVFVGVYTAAPHSGAHLNPAVTLAMTLQGTLPWAQLPVYVAAQLLGAMAGSVLVWLTYKKHYDATTDAGDIQATFCTTPAIAHRFSNFFTEVVGSFVLVFGVLHIAAPSATLGALDALPVALLVLGIGLSLGGPTGYAINPARDLGPRLVHALLPLPHKKDSNWSYSWIPAIAPLAGAVLAVGVYRLL